MMRAIIFDFDYTLGDSSNGIALSVNYALENLGYTAMDISDIKKTIGLSLKETYFVLTSHNDSEKAEEFAKLFKEKADKVMVDNTVLYNGVKEILQKLKLEGHKTAIVTTKFHYRIEQILKKFDSEELIDLIVGAEDVRVEKPNPEGLLWAVEHLGIGKEDVLYVGDSIVDAKTAKNAAVEFVAVLTGTTTAEEFISYDTAYIANNIQDVYKYINGRE